MMLSNRPRLTALGRLTSYGEQNGQLVGFGLTGKVRKEGEYEGRSIVFFNYDGVNIASRQEVHGSFSQWIDHRTCEVAWN